MESLGHEGWPHIKDGPATQVNKWSTAYGMRIQKEAISNEKLSSFDADDEPQPGNGAGSGVRVEEEKQRGTVNFSLAFAITNTTESQPYGRQLLPHTKDRILNSMLESVSWHSLATVAPAAPVEWPVAGSVQCAVSSVEWQQVQPGQCPCELGKHFHWFSWLDLAWFWASHSKRVENAFAARLTATSAIESICQAVSLSPFPTSFLPPSLSLSVCVRASACLLG